MEQIKCPKCGAIDQFYTELKGTQNVARCSVCDAFIKNIAYEEQMFRFGKYKDNKVKDVMDLGYLKWVVENVKPKPAMKTAILKQISNIENLGR